MSLASLVLCWHRLHPPQGGAALRNWQNVRALAELGPVDVLSIGPGEAGPPPAPVRRWLHVDLERLPSPPGLLARLRRGSWWFRSRRHPWSIALWREELRARVTELVRSGKTELVVLEELWFHPFRALAAELGCRTVFDAHNVEAPLRRELGTPREASLVERLRARRLAGQVAALERDLVRRADQVWCCSEADAASLAAHDAREARIHVVPNTVDVEAYRAVRDGSLAPSAPARPPVVAFVGAYAYGPNEIAARLLVEDILPALERAHPEVTLLLVGRDPTPWMLDAARRRRGLEVTGAVADVRPYLARADVVAVPLTVGGGTRLKILEAFAAERPVVSTPKGAEGLDVLDGRHLLLREVGGFADAILGVLADPGAARERTRSAFDLVNERYGWPSAARQIRAALVESGAARETSRP